MPALTRTTESYFVYVFNVIKNSNKFSSIFYEYPVRSCVFNVNEGPNFAITKGLAFFYHFTKQDVAIPFAAIRPGNPITKASHSLFFQVIAGMMPYPGYSGRSAIDIEKICGLWNPVLRDIFRLGKIIFPY